MESNTSTHNVHNHNEASREEEEAGRESVVRRQRVRVIALSASREEEEEEEAAGRESVVRRRRVRVTALSAFVSHSSSTDEVIAEFPFPYEVDVDTVINVVVTMGRGLTDSLVLPTDDEESLGSPPPPDLPIEVIEGLLKKVEVIDKGDVCAICMDELKVNDEARAIGHCSHTFHLDCVAEWVKRKPTCPLCRFEIPINGEGDDDDKGVKRRRLV